MVPESTEAAAPSQRKCIECALEIPEAAKICTHCDSHQAPWKNRLKLLSALTGLATVITAALTYTVTMLPELRKSVAWKDDVEILQFTSRRGLSLRNTGDGAVFVSHLSIVAKRPDGKTLFTNNFTINRQLEKGNFLYAVGDEDRLKGLRLPIATFSSDDVWLKALAAANDAPSIVSKKTCLLFVVYHSQDHDLLNYQQRLKERLRTYTATGTLHIYSLESKKTILVPVNLVGLLQVREESDCADFLPAPPVGKA